MKRYHGKAEAPNGVYLNLSTAEIVQLHEKVRVLPGTQDTTYVKLPTPLAVLGIPFAGLAFVIFLPFVGIVGFVSFLGYKLWNFGGALTGKILHPTAVSWKPGTANLTPGGDEPEKKRKPKTGGDEELSKLEKDITERRKQGEK